MTDTTPTRATPTRSRSRPPPWLAAGLNLLCWTGGLGYFALGQVRKGLITLSVVVFLLVLDAGMAQQGVPLGGMVLAPIVLTVQALTALDAWLLACRRRDGETVAPRDTAVSVFGLLRRMSA